MNSILTIQGLSKSYGARQALSNLSLSIEKGSVFGLLGPNGSGKTTTLGILTDVIPLTAGSFKWFDGQLKYKEARKKIGALLESPNFYGYLSAEKNLKISADIKGVSYSDIERVLKFVNLWERRRDRFSTYSLGMKQRLAIGAALLGNPEVLILDEPTNGLDPQGISEIRELIQTISSEGITIILASHLLDEVEKVCTDVAILKNGNLLVRGKVEELIGEQNIIEIGSSNKEDLRAALQQISSINSVSEEGERFIVKLVDSMGTDKLNAVLFQKGVVLNHLSNKRKNLESEFLELTK